VFPVEEIAAAGLASPYHSNSSSTSEVGHFMHTQKHRFADLTDLQTKYSPKMARIVGQIAGIPEDKKDKEEKEEKGRKARRQLVVCRSSGFDGLETIRTALELQTTGRPFSQLSLKKKRNLPKKEEDASTKNDEEWQLVISDETRPRHYIVLDHDGDNDHSPDASAAHRFLLAIYNDDFDSSFPRSLQTQLVETFPAKYAFVDGSLVSQHGNRDGEIIDTVLMNYNLGLPSGSYLQNVDSIHFLETPANLLEWQTWMRQRMQPEMPDVSRTYVYTATMPPPDEDGSKDGLSTTVEEQMLTESGLMLDKMRLFIRG
jgi:hypothetical protein